MGTGRRGTGTVTLTERGARTPCNDRGIRTAMGGRGGKGERGERGERGKRGGRQVKTHTNWTKRGTRWIHGLYVGTSPSPPL